MSRENKTQPDHYKTKHDFDVIDFNKAYNLNFNLGNVVKYIARAGKKEGESSLDDLKKAINYLQREMKSQGLFSFITGEHPTEEEMNAFRKASDKFLQDYLQGLKEEPSEDHSIREMKKQHLIGFCMNCDNHTELIYFDDIDLFMCRECHDLQFRKASLCFFFGHKMKSFKRQSRSGKTRTETFYCTLCQFNYKEINDIKQ